MADQAAALLRTPAQVSAAVRQSLEHALVAYYPFEETSPVPDDQLPKSKPRRRLAPPPLAPETRGRGGFGGPPVPPDTKRSDLTGEQLQQVVRQVRTLPADLVRDSLRLSPAGLPGLKPAVLEAPLLKEGVKGMAFFFDDNNRGILGDGVGDFERTDAFSIDLWVLPNQVYDDATVFNHREDNNSGNAGYELQLDKNKLQFDLQHSRAGNMIRVVTREPLPLKQWSRVTITYDGSSRAAGVALYVDGVRADAEIVSDNLTRTIQPNGGGLFGGEYLGVMFGRRFRFTPMKDGAIDEFRVFNRALTSARGSIRRRGGRPRRANGRAGGGGRRRARRQRYSGGSGGSGTGRGTSSRECDRLGGAAGAGDGRYPQAAPHVSADSGGLQRPRRRGPAARDLEHLRRGTSRFPRTASG